MDLNFYKKLIRLIESSSISEFSIEEGDTKIKIVKHSHYTTQPIDYPAVRRAEDTVQQQHQNVQPISTIALSENANMHEIKSPIVGTFYRSPAPDADPFIKVGDKISKGTVLCIVEAMKLMNEIESDVDGRISKILVENGTPVEYNQPLFLVEKE